MLHSGVLIISWISGTHSPVTLQSMETANNYSINGCTVYLVQGIILWVLFYILIDSLGEPVVKIMSGRECFPRGVVIRSPAYLDKTILMAELLNRWPGSKRSLCGFLFPCPVTAAFNKAMWGPDSNPFSHPCRPFLTPWLQPSLLAV